VTWPIRRRGGGMLARTRQMTVDLRRERDGVDDTY
jgi:hypothetical protein